MVTKVDWGRVVRILKEQDLSGESYNILSALQIQLLLLLKAAREQFLLKGAGKKYDENQIISQESVAGWLSTFDVPAETVLDNVTYLGRFAQNFLAALGQGAEVTAPAVQNPEQEI